MSEWSLYDEITVALMNQKTIYVGAVVPAVIYEGQVWIDTSTDPSLLKIYDLTNTAWQEYRPVYYETQAGAWAAPTQTPILNGTIVVTYNSTSVATRIYYRSNGAWVYSTVAVAVVIPTIDDSDDTGTNGSSIAGNLTNYGWNIAANPTEVTKDTLTLTISEDDVLICASYFVTIVVSALEGDYASADVDMYLKIDGIVVDSLETVSVGSLAGISFALQGSRLVDTGSVDVILTCIQSRDAEMSFQHGGHHLFAFAVKTA